MHEDILLEQYRMCRELLKIIINTDDLDRVKFCCFELYHKVKYIEKLKIKLLKGDYLSERV